jgi:type IV secretion system protein VirB9
MKVSSWVSVGVACALAVSAAQAELIPAAGLKDSRVRSALYVPDEVYRIAGFVGYEMHIEFEAGETFVGIAAGDLDGIGYSTVDNNLFLKPKAASVGTNLTVVTSHRRYQFDYTASSRRPAQGAAEVIYSLRFTYPEIQKGTAKAEIDEALDAPATGSVNTDYGFCGARSLKPTRAYDDGVHTRLTFDGRTEWPAVFVQGEDGAESLVNFTVRGNELVLHRVVRKIILRRGRLAACVVNQAFEGASAVRDSGTTSDVVQRMTAEVGHD